jgi:hypothetical protein
MVVVGTGEIKTKILNNNYPAVEGLTAGTTLQLNDPILRPEEADLSLRKARGS